MSETLGDALARHIKRVSEKKERWIGYAAEMEKVITGSSVGMKFTMRLMQGDIDEGVAALASGDIARMLAAHEELKSYSDDD